MGIRSSRRRTACACAVTRMYLREQEHITIVAYDKAGNASEPFDSRYRRPSRRTSISRTACDGSHLLPRHDRASRRHGARRARPHRLRAQAAHRSSVAGEFLSPILAENVARVVARGYVIKLAVAMVMIMGLLGLHHRNIAILTAPFAARMAVRAVPDAPRDRAIRQQDPAPREARDVDLHQQQQALRAATRFGTRRPRSPSAGLAKRD